MNIWKNMYGILAKIAKIFICISLLFYFSLLLELKFPIAGVLRPMRPSNN